MYASALIAEFLKNIGSCLYLYPGGTIAPLIHECMLSGVEMVCTRTEQGAGYMALAHGVYTEQPAFVAVTSGPGATNLVTCLADAYYDSIPVVALTGQVATGDLDRYSGLRQRGFQEVPIVKIVEPITKGAFQPRTPAELASCLKKAHALAASGRPGPVLLDLPMDVQLSALSTKELDEFIKELKALDSDQPDSCRPMCEEQVKAGIELKTSLMESKRPLILIGGGGQRDYPALRRLIKRLNIPVVSSMRGLGVFQGDHQLFLGMIGHTGHPLANWAFFNADWVLVLGSRLDVRQTGTETKAFDKYWIQVDIDRNELEHGRFERDLTVKACLKHFLEWALEYLDKDSFTAMWSPWKKEIEEQSCRLKLCDHGKKQGVRPDQLLSALNQLTHGMKVAFVTGVGSHQQWTARHIFYAKPERLFFTSAGHGTMGFCLPTALGIKRLDPTRTVVAIDGDGSFQMNIQELALISQMDLDIKILVMDNSRLGIVSQFQQITFGQDPITGEFPNPDFASIAKSYGITGFKMKEFDQDMLKEWLSFTGPALLHVRIQHDAPVSPMLLAGQTPDNMWYWQQGEG